MELPQQSHGFGHVCEKPLLLSSHFCRILFYVCYYPIQLYNVHFGQCLQAFLFTIFYVLTCGILFTMLLHTLYLTHSKNACAHAQCNYSCKPFLVSQFKIEDYSNKSACMPVLLIHVLNSFFSKCFLLVVVVFLFQQYNINLSVQQ